MHPRYLLVLTTTLCGMIVSSYGYGQPIEAGSATYGYFNSFTTRLFPGTPFNEGTEAVDVLVESEGVFTQVWQEQSGTTIQDELTSLRQTGTLAGVPFEIIGGIEQTPELGPFLGSITQIEQDPVDGSLTSAFRSVAGPFAQVLIDGTYLYSMEPYAFESTVTGLPFPVGSQFSGTPTSEVEIRVRLGTTIDPDNDPVIGLALSDGVVTITEIVPEPSSVALVALAITALGVRWRA